MFGFFNRARSQVGPVAGFGKVPALGDFVRTPRPSDEMASFEEWLTLAMENGEAKRGAAFKAGFASGATHAFVWSKALDKKTRGVLVGVVAPSRDAVGRTFPIVICAPVPAASLASHPHIAPLVLHDFFQRASAAASRASRAGSASDFRAEVVSVAPPSFDDAHDHLKTYGDWVSGRRAADVWTTLFGAETAADAARYALYLVVEATSAYRGKDAPPLSLGLRVPLGRGGDARTMAALWLDLVRHAAGWKAMVPSVFFPLAGDTALVQLGADAPLSVLSDLYVPSEDSDAICDVTGAPDAQRAPSSLPAAVDRALSAPDGLIADVVSELGR